MFILTDLDLNSAKLDIQALNDCTHIREDIILYTW
jgi:hypothetical protein